MGQLYSYIISDKWEFKNENVSMNDKHAKLFLTVVGLYFVTKDVGAVVLYSKRQPKSTPVVQKIVNMKPGPETGQDWSYDRFAKMLTT